MFNKLYPEIDQSYCNNNHLDVSEATLEALKAFLAPLCTIRPALPQDLLMYVLGSHFHDESFLKNSRKIIFTLTEQDQKIEVPDRYQDREYLNQIIDLSQRAQRDIFVQLPQALNSDQALRYGELLCTLSDRIVYQKIRGQFLGVLSSFSDYWGITAVPLSIQYLIKQYVSFVRHENPLSHWSFDDFLNLMEHQQLGSKVQIIHALFERMAFNEWLRKSFNHLLDMRGCHEFFIQQHIGISEELPALTTAGQVEFLNYLSRQPKFVPYYSQLVIMYAINSAKTIVEVTKKIIQNMDDTLYIPTILAAFATTTLVRQKKLLDVIVDIDKSAGDLLQQLLSSKKYPKLHIAIQDAISRIITPIADVPQQTVANDYVVIQDTPLIKEPLIMALRHNLEQEQVRIQKLIDKGYRGFRGEYDSDKIFYADINQLDQVVDAINGLCEFPKYFHYSEVFYSSNVLAELNLIHLIRLARYVRKYDHQPWTSDVTRMLKMDWETLDLRTLSDAMQVAGIQQSPRFIARHMIGEYGDALSHWVKNSQNIVPFFLTYPELLAEALGVIPRVECAWNDGLALWRAVELINNHFDTVPEQYLKRLFELALIEKKDSEFINKTCKSILNKQANISNYLQEIILKNKKIEQRLVAIRWLGSLKNLQNSAFLDERLQQEKDYLVRHDIMAALHVMGSDIDCFLNINFLSTEANHALAQKKFSCIWLNAINCPILYWQNGDIVPQHMIEYWLLAAHEVQLAAGNSLLLHYMDMLCAESRKQFSSFVFDALMCYLNRASGAALSDKGLCVFIRDISVEQAAQLLKYDESHRKSYHTEQRVLMLHALINSDDHAMHLFIAEHYHGWLPHLAQRLNMDEQILKDHLIPLKQTTSIYYDQTNFSVQLNAALQWEVINPQAKAKASKSLPKAKLETDLFILQQQKNQFTALKKRMNAVIEAQKQRLAWTTFDHRTWTQAHWQQTYQPHAIMRVLIEHLIWQEVDCQGDIIQRFRPLADGRLLDVDEQAIQLQPDSLIRLDISNLLVKQKKIDYIDGKYDTTSPSFSCDKPHIYCGIKSRRFRYTLLTDLMSKEAMQAWLDHFDDHGKIFLFDSILE